MVSIDSTLAIKATEPDSSPRFTGESNRVDSSAPTVFSSPPVGFRVRTATISAYLFQDFAQLASQAMPLIPILAGEFGEPRYLAVGDLPPRAVHIAVDNVLWIPGVYGNVDLTSLPDANVELAGESWGANEISPLIASPYGLHLASDSLHYEKPFSRIDYSKGPFSADAVRVRFGRALGRRLTTYLNGTFCNSEGQFVNLPYDGHKVSLQFDYRLSSKSRLRYRHFNLRNEVGVGVPFFPEEWPGITAAFHKEERLYHELDVFFRNKIGLRGFVWQVKEELNDPSRQVRHRLRDGGAELEWREQTASWAFKLRNRIGLEQIESWSIENRERFYNQFSATAAARFTEKMWLHFSGHYAYKADWPAGATLEAKWIAAPTPSLNLWLASGLWKIPPALGERDNHLPYLSQNENLQAADLRRSEAGIHWQRPRFDLKLRLSGSDWPNGFIFQIDSLQNTGFLVNRNRSEFILATQIEWHWEFAPRWQLAGMLAQALDGLPHDYWFWHQPEGYGKVYLETSQSFFDGDLKILPRLVGRFVGKRYSPAFAPETIALHEKELPATTVLDFQIRLGYGDGALLFSWENVLNRPFDWRNGVPAVGRFLRWGFWWNFWN